MHEALVEAGRTLGAWLRARRWHLATAESCTGGLIAAAVTEIAGSSAWFDCGFVTYTNDSKQSLLGVQADTLIAFGAVSEETVREMSAGALKRSSANLAIAISGIAGPSGGTPEKPVGTVCLAWALRSADDLIRIEARTLHFRGDRASVRQQSALLALQMPLELFSDQN